MCPTRQALQQMWRPTHRHPDYEVSWDGRVRNRHTGRVLKPQPAKSGHYQKVNLGRALQVGLHQLVAEAWHGPQPLGRPHVVDHIDNDGRRNVATNLRWLTYSMNTRMWYAMNARMQEAGIANGYHLEPELSEREREELDRHLTAAGF